MKRVLMTLYRNKCHSLYRQFIDNPPKGYKYLTLDDVTDEDIFTSSRTIFGEAAKKILRNRKIIRLAKENSVDIIYCCDGILLFNSSIPWVVDLEHVTGFIAHHFAAWKYAKLVLPFILAQKNLKFILPWTEAGARSIRENIRFRESIERKISPIHLCLREFPKVTVKKNINQSITLLFVTSINYNSDVEFFSKGGRTVISVYETLKRQGVDARLILRSKLPKEYDDLRKDNNVLIHEDILNPANFERMFFEADLFLFPGYQSPGMAFLDAMSYGLPILTTDIFANKEMVHDGENGFLVEFCKENRVYHLRDNFGIKIVPIGTFAKVDPLCDRMTQEFCKRITWFVLNKHELSAFGKYSRELVEREFSLKKRNDQLKTIFDAVISY